MAHAATHPELRSLSQDAFSKFVQTTLGKVVEAAARVRDTTGIDEELEPAFEEQIRKLCSLEVEALAAREVVSQVPLAL
jgi:hypothetical protein